MLKRIKPTRLADGLNLDWGLLRLDEWLDLDVFLKEWNHLLLSATEYSVARVFIILLYYFLKEEIRYVWTWFGMKETPIEWITLTKYNYCGLDVRHQGLISIRVNEYDMGWCMG